jgi:hypothetical protein
MLSLLCAGIGPTYEDEMPFELINFGDDSDDDSDMDVQL